jgi:hypothetical protein
MPAGLTEAGLAFMKCAFASPDFSVDPGKGIPDQFHGRTLAIKDCYTTSLTFTPGNDTYIVQAPVPGYAYFIANVPVGTDPVAFTGVPFPTFETNFGTSGVDITNNFSKFRYGSMAMGLYPTSNLMQFAGSIQVWRVDLNLSESLYNNLNNSEGLQTMTKRLQGISGIRTLAPRDNYSESFIKGAYTFAFDKTQDFEWSDFCAAETFAQASSGPAAGPPVVAGKYLQWDGTHRLTGMGNVNTLVFKITTPLLAVNTGLLRCWNCIELQPDTNSSLFQFSGVSPTHDPVAMELYSRLKMQFPVAMPCAENGKFWETVLRAIMHASKVGMLVPGSVGLISGGVNAIATALGGVY